MIDAADRRVLSSIVALFALVTISILTSAVVLAVAFWLFVAVSGV